MKFPKKDLVGRIIKNILGKRGVIQTQEKLAEIVNKELEKVNKKFTISPSRVRRIALDLEKVGVRVKTRKSGDGEKPDKCPACNSQLKMLYAENLAGDKAEVGFKCTNCSYSGDVESYVPMKYEFKLIK
ncbi:MAG: hypothetical protein ABEK17_04995 [Candidatus Aenigmatarchaeota archaeon]